jgi:hypothetical protein
MRNKRTKNGLASMADIEFVIENMNVSDYDSKFFEYIMIKILPKSKGPN